MFHFSGHSEPPTAFEINERRHQLRAQRNKLFRSSCISDLGHGLFFFALYFYGQLTGPATLTAIVLATVCAIVLASATHRELSRSDKSAVAAVTLGVTMAIPLLLMRLMSQATFAAMAAGLGGGSLVIIGATLGRKVRLVMSDLEDLKPFQDDEPASQELLMMSRQFTEIAHYREQASRILRPHLTYGELKAMRRWAKDKP